MEKELQTLSQRNSQEEITELKQDSEASEGADLRKTLVTSLCLRRRIILRGSELMESLIRGSTFFSHMLQLAEVHSFPGSTYICFTGLPDAPFFSINLFRPLTPSQHYKPLSAPSSLTILLLPLQLLSVSMAALIKCLLLKLMELLSVCIPIALSSSLATVSTCLPCDDPSVDQALFSVRKPRVPHYCLTWLLEPPYSEQVAAG